MITLTKKGIVLEINKDNVIVLSNSGEFLCIKKNKTIPIIGEEYSGTIYKKTNYLKTLTLVASFVLFISMTVIYKMYYEVYNTIEISINPSIRLYTNRNNNIIKIEGVNEDGKILLSKTKNLKGEDSEQAIIDIIETAANLNYLSPNNPTVKIHAEKDAILNYDNINSVIKSKTTKPSSVPRNNTDIKPSSNSTDKNVITNPSNTDKDKNSTKNKPINNNTTNTKYNDKSKDKNTNSINKKDDTLDDDTNNESDDDSDDKNDSNSTNNTDDMDDDSDDKD